MTLNIVDLTALLDDKPLARAQPTQYMSVVVTETLMVFLQMDTNLDFFAAFD